MPDSNLSSDDPRLTELKLRALAEFAAGAGHEINNPVATIVGYAQQLLAAETDPDRRHALTTIGAQALRIRDMIGDVMLFARPPAVRPEPLDLTALVGDVANRLSETARQAGVQIQVDPGAPVHGLADAVQLRVAVSSLVQNSLEALAAGGMVRIGIRLTQSGGQSWAQMFVADNGPGLSDLEREHLFDPFFSGRQAGRGLGFGLSKTWRIITAHGGRISVESPATGGVTFLVQWPCSEPISAQP